MNDLIGTSGAVANVVRNSVLLHDRDRADQVEVDLTTQRHEQIRNRMPILDEEHATRAADLSTTA